MQTIKIRIVLLKNQGTTEKVIGGCRKLNNEELHELVSSPNTVTVIKPRRMA
jgi:hypothetical protein